MNDKSFFSNMRQNPASANPSPSSNAPSSPSQPSPASTPAQPSSADAKSPSQGAAPSNPAQQPQQSGTPASASASTASAPAHPATDRADRGTSLKVAEQQTLHERMNQVYANVARRAFELFEHDGWLAGRDREHWFKAEAELLHPVHVHIKETDLQLLVDAELPGFSATELQYRLDPRRLTIVGRKAASAENTSGRTVYREQCSHEVLRVIDLPAAVDASRASTTLRDGILEFTLPKTAAADSGKPEEQSRAAAASR